MAPIKRRYKFSAMGLLLTLSAYSKINRSDNFQIKSLQTHNPWATMTQCYSGVLQTLTTMADSHLKLVHFCALGFFIFANLVRWTLFGRLSDNEVKNLKDKVSYTIWEFWLGFFIFAREAGQYGGNRSDITGALVQNEFMKYSGLFFCILMLKSFHFICAERAYAVSNPKEFSSTNGQFRRLGYGVLIINLIDILLMGCFFRQIKRSVASTSTLKFEDNILVAIFGFEICHMYPLVFFTGVKFALSHYETIRFYAKTSTDSDAGVESSAEFMKWKESKSKILHLVEISVTFFRFGMSCTFAVVFLYFFTFPFHILPSSYLSLRLLIIKTRCLISFERRKIKLRKLNLPSYIEPDSKCIICFDYLNNSSADGVRCLNYCDHNFHYSCLKSWLDCSNSCPVCRTKI